MMILKYFRVEKLGVASRKRVVFGKINCSLQYKDMIVLFIYLFSLSLSLSKFLLNIVYLFYDVQITLSLISELREAEGV